MTRAFPVGKISKSCPIWALDAQAGSVAFVAQWTHLSKGLTTSTVETGPRMPTLGFTTHRSRHDTRIGRADDGGGGLLWSIPDTSPTPLLVTPRVLCTLITSMIVVAGGRQGAGSYIHSETIHMMTSNVRSLASFGLPSLSLCLPGQLPVNALSNTLV